MANEITTTSEQNQITSKLLSDYFATLTDKLTDVQRNQFAAVAQAFGLNPFKREIYATTYRNKDGQTVMSIVTGYEVYLKRAEMNPNYNGFETNFQVVNGEMGCTCKVYRKDRTMPVTSTVWMSEYSTGRSLWASKPRMMLEKVAIATAFRRAFPCDFGGMPYTTDELPEHMTGADKLEQQGYTEVSQDAQPQTTAKPKAAKKEIDEETKQFMDGMKGLWTQAPEIYQNSATCRKARPHPSRECKLRRHGPPHTPEVQADPDSCEGGTDSSRASSWKAALSLHRCRVQAGRT